LQEERGNVRGTGGEREENAEEVRRREGRGHLRQRVKIRQHQTVIITPKTKNNLNPTPIGKFPVHRGIGLVLGQPGRYGRILLVLYSVKLTV